MMTKNADKKREQMIMFCMDDMVLQNNMLRLIDKAIDWTSVPYFSAFGKNDIRRFKDTDLFEQIFTKIPEDCMKFNLVDTEQIFVNSTHVQACANSKKIRKRVAHEQALWYEKALQKEIVKDWESYGKKPLKENMFLPAQ